MGKSEPLGRQNSYLGEVMKVFIVTVTNGAGGGLLHTSVYSTREKARERLANYCRQCWKEQGHEEILPNDDDEAIMEYFDFWEDEMGVGIDEQEVDPKLEEPEHEHKWGPLEQSRFAGTTHRKCTVEGCKVISIDATDDEE